MTGPLRFGVRPFRVRGPCRLHRGPTTGGFGLLDVPDEETALRMLKECPFRALELRRVVESNERA